MNLVTRLCARCERPILRGETPFILRLELFAAPEMPEVTLEELLRDHAAEIKQLLAETEKLTEAELMRDVYMERTFVLCRRCHRALLANPLGRLAEENPAP